MIWTLSFRVCAIKLGSYDCLVTALCQSQVVFSTFPKVALFARAENLDFALFFWKCCNLEHNQENHSKQTPNFNFFPKFLWEEKSFLISGTTCKKLKCGLIWATPISRNISSSFVLCGLDYRQTKPDAFSLPGLCVATALEMEIIHVIV